MLPVPILVINFIFLFKHSSITFFLVVSPADGSAWGGQVDGREAWGLSRRGPGWVAAGLVLR